MGRSLLRPMSLSYLLFLNPPLSHHLLLFFLLSYSLLPSLPSLSLSLCLGVFSSLSLSLSSLLQIYRHSHMMSIYLSLYRTTHTYIHIYIYMYVYLSLYLSSSEALCVIYLQRWFGVQCLLFSMLVLCDSVCWTCLREPLALQNAIVYIQRLAIFQYKFDVLFRGQNMGALIDHQANCYFHLVTI